VTAVILETGIGGVIVIENGNAVGIVVMVAVVVDEAPFVVTGSKDFVKWLTDVISITSDLVALATREVSLANIGQPKKAVVWENVVSFCMMVLLALSGTQTIVRIGEGRKTTESGVVMA